MRTDDLDQPLVLRTRDEYEKAIRRVAELREHGANAQSHPELARLEGALAAYTAQPGKPAQRKGRPEDGGETP